MSKLSKVLIAPWAILFTSSSTITTFSEGMYYSSMKQQIPLNMNIERKHYLENSFLAFFFTSYNYWLFKLYQIAKSVSNVSEISLVSIKWSENDSLIETNNFLRFERYPSYHQITKTIMSYIFIEDIPTQTETINFTDMSEKKLKNSAN